MMIRKSFRPAAFACPSEGCKKICKTESGLKLHFESVHAIPEALLFSTRESSSTRTQLNNSEPHANQPDFEQEDGGGDDPPSPTFSSRRSPRCLAGGSPLPQPRSALPHRSLNGLDIHYHPIIDGTPCDQDGNDLESGHPPPPPTEHGAPGDYYPFASRAEFEFAEFIYVEEEMSAKKIDKLMQLLASLYHEPPPVSDHKELYAIIDSIKQGDVPWNSFSISYNGPQPQDGAPIPAWMNEKYEVWFRDPLEVIENQIGNPDFRKEMDFAPKRVFKKGKRRYRDLMSGNWAWEQADKIAEDEATHGAISP